MICLTWNKKVIILKRNFKKLLTWINATKLWSIFPTIPLNWRKYDNISKPNQETSINTPAIQTQWTLHLILYWLLPKICPCSECKTVNAPSVQSSILKPVKFCRQIAPFSKSIKHPKFRTINNWIWPSKMFKIEKQFSYGFEFKVLWCVSGQRDI